MRSRHKLSHPRSRAIVRSAGKALLVAVAYYAGAKAGILFRFEGVTPSVLWPPNAILTAVLLLSPPRRWAVYLLAALPAHLAVELGAHWPVPLVLALFLTNCSEALIAATWVRVFSGGTARFDSLRGVIVFIAGAGLVAPFLSSFPDSAAMAAFRGDSYWLDWRTRFFANVLAELTLVPPLVMMARSGVESIRRASPAQILEQSWFWLGLLTVGFVVFHIPGTVGGTFGLLFRVPPFFLLPFLIWAPLRLGPAETSLAVLTVELLAISAGAKGLGPFLFAPSLFNVAFFQLYLFVWAVLLMALAGLMEEQRASEAIKNAILASVASSIAVFNRWGRAIAMTEGWGRAEADGRESSIIATGSGESYTSVCRRVLPPDTADLGEVLDSVHAVITGSRREFSFQYPKGTPPNDRWFIISAVPLRSPAGGAVVAHSDITAQRHLELESKRIRDELLHFSRFTTVGALAATLAHELNQPLGAVLGNAEAGRLLLERAEVERAELEPILQDIIDDTQRASNVIRRVSALLRRAESELHPIDVAEVADEVLDLAHSELITRNVAVTRRMAAGLPPVLADRVQLQQVFLNLILNACDAMTDTPIAQRELTVTIESDSGDAVHVSVGDTGGGISPAVQDALFAPFVTTKTRGIGLGLSICHWIITGHGGRLWGENNRERGATFHFALPAAAAQVAGNSIAEYRRAASSCANEPA